MRLPSCPFALCRRLAGAAALLGALVVPGSAQYFYTVSDLGQYVAQDIQGPATNAAGWAVSTYSSAFPLNSYSLVQRPGDPGFSPLFPSAYLFMDAAYGVNDKNMVVGSMNLFYASSGYHQAYRADANLTEVLRLEGITRMAGSGFTILNSATRILDDGTIFGLGMKEDGLTHVFQLNPIAPELHWDSNGATPGLPQGSGTWSHASSNWTANTAGTSVAGWTDGGIARFYYNTAPATVTVTDNVVVEGIWAGYTPIGGMTIDASGGGALTFTGQGFIRGAGSASLLRISAPLAGSAGLWLTGGGDIYLQGDNTYTGQTRIETDVYASHQNSLGATGVGNETIVASGGRLRFEQALTVGETFLLDGGWIFTQPDYENLTARNVELTGPLVLQNDSWIGGDASRNAGLTVSGAIGESGGAHQLRVSGGTVLTGTNTFTGDLQAFGDGVVISQVTNAGVAGQLGQGSRVTLGWDSEGAMPGDLHYTGGTAATNREFHLEGGGNIDVVNAATTLTLSGAITGPRFLGKTGAGTLVLTGSNTFSGGTWIDGGTLRIVGTNALGSGHVTIGADGILTGAGTFTGNLQVNGLYSPGDGVGLIALPGSVTLGGGAGIIEFEIGGLARGTQYDALDIGGTFSSEGSIRLTLVNGFMPSVGDSFNLLTWGTAGDISFLDFNGTALTSGLYWDTTAFASTGVISVTDVAPAIPEPSAYAALTGLAALGTVVWRRRRATGIFLKHTCAL